MKTQSETDREYRNVLVSPADYNRVTVQRMSGYYGIHGDEKDGLLTKQEMELRVCWAELYIWNYLSKQQEHAKLGLLGTETVPHVY